MELDATHFPFCASGVTSGFLQIELANFASSPLCPSSKDLAIRVFHDEQWDFSGSVQFIQRIARENPGARIYIAGFREYISDSLEYNYIPQGKGALEPILANLPKDQLQPLAQNYGVPMQNGAKTMIPYLHIFTTPRGVRHPSWIEYTESGENGGVEKKLVSMEELTENDDLTLQWNTAEIPDVDAEVYILTTNQKQDGTIGSLFRKELVDGHLLLPSPEPEKKKAKLGNPAEEYVYENEDESVAVEVSSQVWKACRDNVTEMKGQQYMVWAGDYQSRTAEEYASVVAPVLMETLVADKKKVIKENINEEDVKDARLVLQLLNEESTKQEIEKGIYEEVFESYDRWKSAKEMAEEMAEETAARFDFGAADMNSYKAFPGNDLLRRKYLTGVQSRINSLGLLSGTKDADLANVFPSPVASKRGNAGRPLYELRASDTSLDSNRSIIVKGRQDTPTIVLVEEEVAKYGQEGRLTLCAAALKLHSCQDLLGKLVRLSHAMEDYDSRGVSMGNAVSMLVSNQIDCVPKLRAMVSWHGAEMMSFLDQIQRIFDTIVDTLVSPFNQIMKDEGKVYDAEGLRSYVSSPIEGDDEKEKEQKIEEKDSRLESLGKMCLLKGGGTSESLPTDEIVSKLYDLFRQVSEAGQQALNLIGEDSLFDCKNIGNLRLDVEGTEHQNVPFAVFSLLNIEDLMAANGQLIITWGYDGDLDLNQNQPSLKKEMKWNSFGKTHSRENDKKRLSICKEYSDDDPEYENGKVLLASKLTYEKGKKLLEASKSIRKAYACALPGRKTLQQQWISRFFKGKKLRLAITPGGMPRIQPVYKEDRHGQMHLSSWNVFYYGNIQCNDSTQTATCEVMVDSMTDKQLKVVLRERYYIFVHELLEEYKRNKKTNPAGKVFTGLFNIESPGYFRAFEPNQDIQGIRLRPDNGLEILLKGGTQMDYDSCYEVLGTFLMNGQPFVQAYRVKLTEKAKNRDTSWLLLPPGASQGNKDYVVYMDSSNAPSPMSYTANAYKLDCAKQAVLEAMSRVDILRDVIDPLKERFDAIDPLGSAYIVKIQDAMKAACLAKGLAISIKYCHPTENSEFVEFDPQSFAEKDNLCGFAVLRNHTVGLLGNLLLDPSEKNALSLTKTNLDLLAGVDFKGFDRYYEVTLM